MDDVRHYLHADSLVERVKTILGIGTPIDSMADDEIAQVAYWIGEHASDTVHVDGKVVIRRHGIDMMLTVTLLAFPKFYARNGLSQYN